MEQQSVLVGCFHCRAVGSFHCQWSTRSPCTSNGGTRSSRWIHHCLSRQYSSLENMPALRRMELLVRWFRPQKEERLHCSGTSNERGTTRRDPERCRRPGYRRTCQSCRKESRPSALSHF